MWVMLMENYEEQEVERGIDFYYKTQKKADEQVRRAVETAAEKNIKKIMTKKEQYDRKGNIEDIADIKERSCLQSLSLIHI